MFNYFDRVQERNRRTDGQDIRTRATAQAALMHSIARQKAEKARGAV